MSVHEQEDQQVIYLPTYFKVLFLFFKDSFFLLSVFKQLDTSTYILIQPNLNKKGFCNFSFLKGEVIYCDNIFYAKESNNDLPFSNHFFFFFLQSFLFVKAVHIFIFLIASHSLFSFCIYIPVLRPCLNVCLLLKMFIADTFFLTIEKPAFTERKRYILLFHSFFLKTEINHYGHAFYPFLKTYVHFEIKSFLYHGMSS